MWAEIARAARRPRRRVRWAPAPAVAAATTLIAAGCGGAAATGRLSCEGSPALCARTLDRVVLAGTHNSFAASEQPGWYFASQRRGIQKQLQDGIRALLVDVHYGVRDPATGRVRTDLRAEGSDRNKVARQVPPVALKVADRVAGRVGVGKLAGSPQLYLCHTLCELGADPLAKELEVIRRFLQRHPGEVLVVIVEDYVPPEAIAAAFADAGLDPFVATLHDGQRLPTLGELVRSDRRLLVFAEVKGGSPAWYMPAFTFIQDTPLGAVSPTQLSCSRYRGAPNTSLMLINHWIPPFPPNPQLNAAIGRKVFLRERVRRCMRERHTDGAIVAVDFYERTSVVAVARELNGEG
jgi:hypothetical protein